MNTHKTKKLLVFTLTFLMAFSAINLPVNGVETQSAAKETVIFNTSFGNLSSINSEEIQYDKWRFSDAMVEEGVISKAFVQDGNDTLFYAGNNKITDNRLSAEPQGMVVFNDSNQLGTSSYNNQYSHFSSKIGTTCTDDKWYFETNISIDSLNGKGNNGSGFGFDFDFGIANKPGAKLYRFIFGTDGISIVNRDGTLTTDMCNFSSIIGDGKYHKLSISYMGGGKIAIFIDGQQAAVFSSINAVESTDVVWSNDSQEGFRFFNLCPKGTEGITKVFMQNAKFAVNAISSDAGRLVDSAFFVNDCQTIGSWTSAGNDNTENTFVVDSNSSEKYGGEAAGSIRFYADPIQNKPHEANGIVSATLSNAFTQDEDWTIVINMKINELLNVGKGLEAYDGFRVTYMQNAKDSIYYNIFFADNSIIFRMGGTRVERVNLPAGIIGDGKYHDYSLVWNAKTKTMGVCVDEQVIGEANYSKDTQTQNSASNVLSFAALNYFRSGANTGKTDVYLNNVSVIKNASGDLNLLVESPCDNVAGENWEKNYGVKYLPSDKQFSENVTAIIDDTTEGKFKFYAHGASKNNTWVEIKKDIALNDTEKWLLEADIQIDALKKVADLNKSYFGFNATVATGNNGKLFRLFFTEDGIYVNRDKDNFISSNLIPLPNGIIGDGKVHKYGFAWDGKRTLSISVDKEKIGIVSDILQVGSEWGSTMDVQSSFLYFNSENMQGSGDGVQDVYIDNVVLRKNVTPSWSAFDPKIKFINILPTADKDNLQSMVILSGLSPEIVESRGYKVKLDVYPYTKDYLGKETNPNKIALTTKEQNVEGNRFIVDINGLDANTQYTIEAKLINTITGLMINSYVKDFMLETDVQIIDKDGITSGAADITYLYTDVAAMARQSHNWSGKTYSFDGKTNHDYIESLENGGQITLPVTGSGKYAVYVGYLNETEEFDVSNGKDTSKIEVIIANDRIPHSKMALYGARSVGEIFTTVVDFSDGGQFKLIPKKNLYSRIAYIKLKPLTNEDSAIWNSKSDGVNRLMLNNDGYSDFYAGYYTLPDASGTDQIPNIENLLWAVLERFKGQDVGAIDWTLGTTLGINQPSEFSDLSVFKDIYLVMMGRENDINDNQRKDKAKLMYSKLRSGDKVAIKAFMAYISRDISPLELLEKRGDEMGTDINVSIRMEAFYDPASNNGWLNGSYKYEDYKKIENKAGTEQTEISLSDKNFQDYIINILKESIEKYNADGVNLDFDRYPYVLGWEIAKGKSEITTDEQLYAEKAKIVTEFMRRVRTELPNGTRITTRVPITQYEDQFGKGRGYIDNGLDFAAWLNEGLIDVIIPSSISYEEFQDLTPFINAVSAARANGKDVSWYCGITSDLKGHDLTKEEEDLMNQGIAVNRESKSVSLQQYRLRAHEAYQKGAEAIYIFNNWKAKGLAGYGTGNRAANEKWHQFAYEAESVQNLASIAESERIEGIPDPIVPPIYQETPQEIPQVNPITPADFKSDLIDIEKSWAKKYINKLFEGKIVNGDENKAFHPENAISRAEFATMLAKALKLDIKNAKYSFTDVADDAWYAGAVRAVASAGIMHGSNKIFRANENITRQEAMTAIAKAIAFLKLNITPDESILNSFADIKEIAYWAIDGVKISVASGIISGSNGNIHPTANITKEEAAKVISMLVDLIK